MPAGASDDNPRAAKRSRVAEGEEDPHFGADSVSFDKTKVVADFLETKTKHRPTVLIVCGSGLGGLADDIEDKECATLCAPSPRPKTFLDSLIPLLCSGMVKKKLVHAQ